MFAIYYGEDDYSRQEAVRALRDRLGAPEMASLNTAVLAGAQVTLAEVIAQASAVPFLASGRLVVVEGLLALFEPPQGRRGEQRGRMGRGRAESSSASPRKNLGDWEALGEAARILPESNALVLSDGSLSPANPLLRALRSAAQVREFQPLRGAAVAEWVRHKVVSQGGRIASQAVSRLVEACGSNLWALDSEVAKLVLHAGGRPITLEDVEALVSDVREESIFSVVDDVIERRYPQARRRLQRLVEGGAGAGQVITMLGRQVRMLIAGKDLAAQKASRTQLEEGMGTRSDFALRKALGQAEHFTMEELIHMHRRLLDYDLSMKTGRLSEETALELLLAELCGVGQGASEVERS